MGFIFSNLYMRAFSLCISSFLFPFTTLIYNSNISIFIASLIRFIAGALSAQVLIAGITLTGQRFGNNYVSSSTAIILITGSVHSFIGNIVQTEIYETYHKWKPI